MDLFSSWKTNNINELKSIEKGINPKIFIKELGDNVLNHYKNNKLINKYDIYQVFMEYWNETMQDDLYILSDVGFKIELSELVTKKNKKEIITYYSDLVPAELIENRYFFEDKHNIDDYEEKILSCQAEQQEFLEKYCAEGELLNGLSVDIEKSSKGVKTIVNEELYDGSTMSKTKINAFIKANKNDKTVQNEIALLKKFIELLDKESACEKQIKEIKATLYNNVLKKYDELSTAEIKILVVEDKWLSVLQGRIEQLLNDLTQKLSQRVKEVAVRYENTLPKLEEDQEKLKNKVKQHLAAMGY